MKSSTIVFLLAGFICRCPGQNVPAWETALHENLNLMADRLTATVKPWVVPDKVFRVEDFGAVADGQTVNSMAINRAIETCAGHGGGVVVFAKGDYVSGTIDLQSGVMLEVEAGARLVGSTNLADYPEHLARRRTRMDYVRHSLIFAEGCERIGLRGTGEIDGRGTPAHFPVQGQDKSGRTSLAGRPFLLRIIDCKEIVVDGIRLKDSAGWMQDYLNCENLLLQGVRVDNQANRNNDGIDIDGCSNVIVRHCFVNSEDDGLCFKGAGARPMENVLVENSQFYSACNAIKFGTDSQGDFRNVLVRNVEAGGPANEMRALVRRRAHSAVSWESVDGGTVENLLVTNLNIVRTDWQLFLRLGRRNHGLPDTPEPRAGVLRRVVFNGITGGDNGRCASVFSGIPSACIEDVVVRHAHWTVAGGGAKPPAGLVIPERESDYPDAPMFGRNIPAYGFWVRHARDVRFIDVVVTPEKPDARPFISSGGDTQNMTLEGAPL
jgi:polygalacturonase